MSGILRSFSDQSPGKTARMAGLFYLIFILTFALASYIRSQIIVFGDAVTTAGNIATSQGLFRLAFASELVSALFFVLAAWALYGLLRPVDKNLALLFLLLNLAGVVTESLNMLNLLAPLTILNGADYLKVFQTGQLQAMAMSSLYAYMNGIMIAQLFFGTWLLPLGYLLYKSRLVPRFLAVLIVLDFFGVLIWFFQYFFLPDYGVLSYPGLAVSFVAEFSLSLWLLIMGVKEQGPRTPAS
jgi:hypothetical protein